MKSLRKQLGFIYLTTGANGAGKTLFTLKEVRERSVKEGRPVYHNGRFKLTADFGWKQIDFKDWQSCPDGSIFLIDECHNDMPVRRAGSEVPDHIRMLAEHRSRGFDFYLITQHPGNIDVFVRRIVGSPGWHRHLKNFKGSPLVSKIEWSAVNIDCEKPSSGDTGSVEMVTRPTEVYKWYESATLHTAQRKIPKQVFLLAGIALAIPVLGYLAWNSLGQTTLSKVNEQAQPPGSVFAPSVPTSAQDRPTSGPVTPASYVASYAPRVPDLPHTAPVYDGVTTPVVAPYPAACVQTADKCTCYSQQATRLHMADSLCRDIVKNGFFVNWQQPQPQTATATPEAQAERAPAGGSVVPVSASGPTVSVIGDSWNQERIARSFSAASSRETTQANPSVDRGTVSPVTPRPNPALQAPAGGGAPS